MFFALLLLATEAFARVAPIWRPTPYYPTDLPIRIPIKYAVEDADDKIKINLDEIAKIAGQTQQIIQILKSDDEDLENGLFKSIGKFAKKIGRGVTHALPAIVDTAGKVAQIGKILGYEAEDVEDKIRINPHKIVEIAGKVNQIGQILGYDAEDVDDELATICAIIGAVCAVANTGINVYNHVKGDDESELLAFDAEDVDDKFRINLGKIVDIAGKVATIGGILGFEAEDVEDKIKINPHKIVDIAGKINQIGQILGYDAEDVDDKLKLKHILRAAKIVATVAPLIL